MKKIIFFTALTLILSNWLHAQYTLFFENFDEYPGEKPPGWTTELEVSPNRIWDFVNGGGTQHPEIPGSRRPTNAYSGTVNALYFFESLGNESVILITPPIDLEFSVLTELRFRHAQMSWNSIFGIHNDELRVYYKTHSDSSWVEANKIAEYTEAVESWSEQTILIPEEAFSPTCYFAFKATTKYGWGVCIDDVTVVETGELDRYVDDVTISQESTDPIPTGSKYNPLLQVDVKVKGNTSSVTLNSLEVKSLNSSDGDIETNGVKLFVNHSNKDFYASQLYDSASFSSGKAIFSDLSLDLPTGYTSLWITCDVKSGATHLNTADIAIEADKMDINGTTYPAVEASPSGNRTIYEAVFYDDFVTDKGWVLSGDFERNRPTGLGGTYIGNPDPEYAAGDTMIIGNDLTGLGFLAGDYEPNVAKYVNLAVTPSFDLFYYNNVKLNFLRWLNVENQDTASIELSLNNGSTWNEIWTNDNNLITDNQWTFFSLNIPAAYRKSDVKMRINLGPTTLNNHFSGWNIENFSVTGNYVEYDVGPTLLSSPSDGCGHTSAETVSIKVRNFGPGATPAGIPVRYSFNGGSSYVNESIPGSIPFEGEISYDFTNKVDLSLPGTYEVIIETLLGVDEESSNNTLSTTLYVDPTYSIPYFQNFEIGADFWRKTGIAASWAYGAPAASVIHTAGSGTKAWVTNLTGSYNNNEDSHLMGPCFDFTGIDFPVFECKIFTHLEKDMDGVNLEYSLDNGDTWERVGNKGDGDAWNWNWYNSDIITVLDGNHGWTDEIAGWRTARILLDPLVFRDQPSVKFRFHLASNESDLYEGIGIDDIYIYDAPRDIGVISIDSPVTACAQDVSDHVVVTIQNFGLDTLMAGDTIIAGYDYESDPTVIDTFILASNVLKNATFQHSFTQFFSGGSMGTKNITAFSLLPDDGRFYNETFTNDSSSKSFDILETPFVDLPYSIYTVRPDTIVLDAYTGNPADTYLWQDWSTDPQFHVTEIATAVYWVIIDNGLCTFSDTTYVYRLIADAGVSDIIYPVSDCEIGDAVLPKVEITNYGTDTLLAGDQLTVGYQLDSDPAVEELLVLDSTFYPDSTIVYTFTTTPMDMSAIATYSLTAYTILAYDDNPGNDSFNTNVTVYGITSIDLGPAVVIRSLTYVIDAGAGYDSYLWNDGSTNRTLLVDTTGWYSVTVKQGTQCENRDSVHVTLVFPDIKIDQLHSPVSSCGLSSSEILYLYVKNSGSDTVQVQDTIAFNYRMDAGPLKYDTLFTGTKVFPGDSVFFSFSDPFDMSSIGSYTFTIEAFYRMDSVLTNNTINQAVQVYGYPTVSLGPDQISYVKELILDAGPGYSSYLWQDGSTNRYYTVDYDDQTPDHIYSVTVTNTYGCPAMDEIQVTFEDITDVVIDSLVNPLSACYLGNQELMKIHIRNVGTVTLSNPQFQVTAIVDGGSPATEQILLSKDFLPNDFILYTFTKKFDFSAKGDYNIRVSVTYAEDDDTSNDTLVRDISHYINPTVDLGGVNDTIKTTLPYLLDAGADFAVYEWNGVEGSRTLEATTTGWYTLVVTDLNGCTATDSVFIASLTSVPETKGIEDNLLVYPNPAGDFLNIVLEIETVKDLYLEILNGIGQKIFIHEYPSSSQIHETLDVSGMSKGFYILKVWTKEEEVFRKIIIE